MSMAGSTVAMDIADINKAGLLLLCFHWFSPTLLRMSCLKTEAWEQLRTQSPVATSGPHACVHTEGGLARQCEQWCFGLRWLEPMVEAVWAVVLRPAVARANGGGGVHACGCIHVGSR
jgi:hypothetical protein